MAEQKADSTGLMLVVQTAAERVAMTAVKTDRQLVGMMVRTMALKMAAWSDGWTAVLMAERMVPQMAANLAV